MGEVYYEFKKELAALAKKYHDKPDKELNKLLHIALEREELVTTAYRANFLSGNVEKLSLDKELNAIVKHALIWVWKDEDMHTVYTRGALLKSKNIFHKFKVMISQFQGFVGGWAASIIQHLKFREAPFSVAFAKFIAFIGKMSGKISKGIGKELKFGSFKQFCFFNIDAEKTARICWERILILAEKDERFTEEFIKDFQRIIFDEQRHERIFKIIYDVLEENGELTSTYKLEEIITEIRAVSEYFLPQKYRLLDKMSPVGKGGDVWSFANKSDLNKYAFFQEQLPKVNLTACLKSISETKSKPLKNISVVIKVSFSMGYNKEDLSPITDPALLEILCKYLSEQGVRDIKVIDIDSIYNNFFQNRSVNELATYFDFKSDYYEIINASNELVYHQFSRGIGNYSVSKTWKDADFRINLAKVRSHPIEMALLAVNNLEWLTGNTKEFVFLDRIVDRKTTTNMLIDDFPPHYNILDTYDNIPVGILGVMGCKKPIDPKRFYFSEDILAIDRVVIKHLKFNQLPQKSALLNAIHWFGLKGENYKILGEDSEIKSWKSPTKNFFWTFLSFLSYPMYLFFSKKGQLFVPKMDLDSFPYKKKPNFIMRGLSSFNRWITNLPN